MAGITIVYVFGENGIFKLAQDAKDKTENAIEEEKDYINKIDNMVNGYVNGTTTPTTPEEVPVEEIKSDWETIEKIAKEIAKDDSIINETEKVTVTVDDKEYTINVGDIFEVKYNDEVRRVRVLGFKHDDLVDKTVYGGNHTKASISFEFLDFMTGSTYKSMNTSNSNTGGWAATQMRKDLNGYSNSNAAQSGAIGGLGTNLNNKSYIKQVKKKYIAIYDDASSVTTCNDYLWMLAASEVVNAGYQSGAYGLAITSEGSQYKYYQGVTDAWNSTSTGRQKYNALGNMTHWWLRSPYYNSSGSFCMVGVSGYFNNTTYSVASSSTGVAPGFSI